MRGALGALVTEEEDALAGARALQTIRDGFVAKTANGGLTTGGALLWNF